MSPATNLVDKRQGTDADPFLKLLVLATGRSIHCMSLCRHLAPIMHLPVRRADSKGIFVKLVTKIDYTP